MIAALARYKLVAEALAALALLAAIAWGFHEFCEHERDIGRTQVQQQWDAQKALDAETLRLRSQANQSRVDDATNKGAQNEAVIKTLAATSAAAVASMRDTVATFQRSLSTTTAQTAVERAITASALLADCSGRYQSLAERADRHANDARTLSEAWPVNLPPPASPAGK